MSRNLQHTILFAIAALVVVADQLTKAYIRNNLALFESFAPIPALGDFFTIINTHNTGAAFGMFKQAGGIFTVVAILVAGAIVFYYRQIPEGQIAVRLALGLQLGGAIGNLIDRLFFGTVTDFIFFHWGNTLNAPIFNLADLSITSGVIVLALLMLKEHNAEQAAKAAAVPPAEPTASTTHE
ncbi:MAG: signal peptidase II [Chloroflexi bacterium]|nr:signal peptidase II [Chloroflexota bacterium]